MTQKNVIKTKLGERTREQSDKKEKIDKKQRWVKIAWLGALGAGIASWKRLNEWSEQKNINIEEIWDKFDSWSENEGQTVLSSGIREEVRKSRIKWGQKAVEAGKNLEENCEEEGIKLLLRNKENEFWPILWEEMFDPPEMIYYQGDLSRLKDKLPISVVGTRKMTLYGAQATEKIVRELVEGGATVISGFMYGIDQEAAKVAMKWGGKTVGVLGVGLGNRYWRRRDYKLIKDFIESGQLLISEFEPWSITKKQNFPIRNRLVAGMSWASVVVEAAEKSGTQITAKLAIDYGRDVWAVSGPITSPYAEGTKRLIQDGANLATTGSEILATLRSQICPTAQLSSCSTLPHPAESPEIKKNNFVPVHLSQLSELAQKIYKLLEHHQLLNIEMLWENTQLEVFQIQSLLTELMLADLVYQIGDNYAVKK